MDRFDCAERLVNNAKEIKMTDYGLLYDINGNSSYLSWHIDKSAKSYPPTELPRIIPFPESEPKRYFEEGTL